MPRTDPMAPSRDLQLDAARGLAVLLVLLGHLLQPVFYGPSGLEPGPALAVWRVIYAFHMPFFFLLCGMVDRIKGEAGLGAACLSALKLAVVALAFGTLALVPQALDGTLSPADALRDALYGRNFGLGVLWFLVALGLVRVIDAAARAATFPKPTGSCWAAPWPCRGSAARRRSGSGRSTHSSAPCRSTLRAGGSGHARSTSPRCWAPAASRCFCSARRRNFVHVATGQYGDPALFAVTAVAGSAFALAIVGRLRGPPRAAAALLGRASFELYIVSGFFLLLAPHWPDWDRWDRLALLAALGLPLHLIVARALRGPIRAVRRASDGVVDGLADGLAGRRRRARPPDSATRPRFSGADP
ncbi:acyltransferase family protein [Methylobacterium oryzae CBMB20]